MDWLEMPLLREHSFHFVRHELLQKLKSKQKLSKEETIFSIYGIAAAFFTVFTLISVLVLYGENLLSIFTNLFSFGK
jgi:hypothetical protein